MSKIISICPKCQKKNVREVSHFNLGKSRFITLDCGHSYKETLSITSSDSIHFKDGKTTYPYQMEGIHFAERSGFNCLIGDEPGLGKTIQAIGILDLHLEELKPILIVVKASLTIQWQKYILQQLEKFAQIVTTKDKFLPGISIYIVSYDTAPKLESEIIKRGIKTIILDECQMIKNHDAQRTNGIRSIVRKLEIKNKIFLSGTPIKNNAIEFWPSLNLLRPEMFPNRADWLRWDVGYWLNSKGVWKPGGLKDPERFKERTKDFIIRRERAEVFPELPDVTRDFRYHEISHDEMKAYSMGVKKLEAFLKDADEKAFNFNSQLQGHIMILRHITGLAKINPILEYIDERVAEALESDKNNWKLAIFYHHIDVGDILQEHIRSRNIGVARILSSMNAQLRTDQLDRFRNDPGCNIIMLPSLAASEGFDLDFCDTGIILEREWNPANEEQIEGRFIRATREMLEKARAGEVKVNMLYPIAVNTIDEFFSELVERKRQYMKESLSGKSSDIPWNESQVMLDLARIAVSRMKGI